MKVVSVINIKGGVGKTTLTANLGAELASRGYRVLLIDLDPQASLTFSFFTIDYWNQILAPTKTIKSWFESEGKPDPVSLSSLISSPDVVKPAIAGKGGSVDLICSHLGLINIDLELAASMAGGSFDHARDNYMKVHRKLANEVRERYFRSRYDVVLIDCAPNLNLLNKNALIASDWVVIPAKADHLSTLGIDYLLGHRDKLIDSYNRFRRGGDGSRPYPLIGPDLLGVVFTMVNVRGGQPIRAQQAFIDEVKRMPKIDVFDSIVRYNAGLFATAPRDGVPVAVNASVKTEVADELDGLADEFIKKADLKRIDA
jgi:chromosome partitioning protein